MQNIYITGTGFWIPEDGLTTNDEVVNSYNTYVNNYNSENAEAISDGSLEALAPSSSEFIEKASGIKTRYLYDKHNCLDPNRMKPKTRPELADNTSILAEMGIESAKKAIANAGITAIDQAISVVGTEREQMGAVMNRLDHAVANLSNVSTNLKVAKGRIEDADFAAETANLARTQVLQQASMAMLSQANASKQNILALFQ